MLDRRGQSQATNSVSQPPSAVRWRPPQLARSAPLLDPPEPQTPGQLRVERSLLAKCDRMHWIVRDRGVGIRPIFAKPRSSRVGAKGLGSAVVVSVQESACQADRSRECRLA